MTNLHYTPKYDLGKLNLENLMIWRCYNKKLKKHVIVEQVNSIYKLIFVQS